MIRMTGAGEIYASKFIGDGTQLSGIATLSNVEPYRIIKANASKQLVNAGIIQGDGAGDGITIDASSMTVVNTALFKSSVAINGGMLDLVQTDLTQGYSIKIGTSATAYHVVVSTAGNVGIGTTSPMHKLDIAGSIYSRRYGLNYNTSITVDWNNGNIQSIILTGNTTLTFSNGQDGGKCILILKQDSTGSRIVSWPNSVRFPGGITPTLFTEANKVDYIGFIYNGVDGKYDAVAFIRGL